MVVPKRPASHKTGADPTQQNNKTKPMATSSPSGAVWECLDVPIQNVNMIAQTINEIWKFENYPE